MCVCVCVCMQICMTYVFSQETFVRGTKTRVFHFMDLKEWSKDTVMYSQQVLLLSYNTRKPVIMAIIIQQKVYVS